MTSLISPSPAVESTLRDISATARNLARSLSEAQRAATAALAALANGQAVPGSSFGGGPLGHQNPNDIAVQTARLSVLVDQAMMLGATTEQIVAAHTYPSRGGDN